MTNTKKISGVASLLLVFAMSFFANPFSGAQAQLQGTGTANPQCYAFNINLARGSRGQDVYNLQTVLMRENLLYIAQPTSYFGALTYNALVAFQEKYAAEVLAPIGLSRGTGYAGVLTRAKLNALYGCGGIVPPVPGPFPAISGISGPSTLVAGQTGSWTINVTNPTNLPLSYSVIWGDEMVPLPMMNNSSGSLNYGQTTTFTHVYASAGTYNPIFYVRNNLGNTVSSSISVHVTNTNSAPVIHYLQPNSGRVGSMVAIFGTGFTPTGNRIVFGNLGVENNPNYNLNSYDGRTIVFMVPSTNYLTCWYSNPACMAAAYQTQPGVYPVSVINANGQSSSVSFTVTSASCTPNWQCGWQACVNGYQSMGPLDTNYCGTPYQGTPAIACPAIARVCQ